MAMLSVSMARCRCGDREICAEKTTRPTICLGKPASAQEMHMWITSSQQQAHPEEMRLHLPQSQPQVLNAPRVRMPVRTVQPGRNRCCRTRTGPRRGPVRP